MREKILLCEALMIRVFFRVFVASLLERKLEREK